MDTFFDTNEKELILRLKGKAAHRSNTFHDEVKHCYEGTFLGVSKKFHFGFTNNNASRTFVSLLSAHSYTNLPVLYYRTSSSTFFYIDSTIFLNLKDTGMFCLDSSKSEFYVIFNDITEKYAYSGLPDHNTWYIFLDGSEDDTQTKVKLNVGFEKFKNTIPDGFSPWIFGIAGIKYLERKIIICTSYYSHKDYRLFIYILMSNT